MSTIRRQSIISSLIVYLGFAIGLLNTYLFTREGGLTAEQYGLTNTFIAFANIMSTVAAIGMPGFIAKFFPYYRSHLPDRENDQLAWALLLPTLGFILVLTLGLVFKHTLVDRVFNNSPLLLEYYYLIFPFGYGFTIFVVLESYAWQHRKAVLSNFLKEVLFRFFVTVLILLTTFGIIRQFSSFISVYAFLYLALVIYLVIYFRRNHSFHLHFRVTKVTRKFRSKILGLIYFVWGGGIVFTVASVFDGIVIVAVLPEGLGAAGVFYLAQNISSLIQAPQRAVISASVGALSQAWKEKDLEKIDRIYHRSSINQLIFSVTMFCLIWLNFEDGVRSFHLQASYLEAKWIFFYLALARIIDMGTGVNAQIIGTSTYWRFEFISGLLLFAVTLPLTYQLTRTLGVVGPGVANLVGFGIYNLIRYLFLWKKFKMQPFTIKSLLTLLLGGAIYFIAYFLFRDFSGIGAIVLRSLLTCALFAVGILWLKLTPDALPVLKSMTGKLRTGR